VLDLGMNTSLQTKELAAQPLTKVPAAIARLTNLRVLDLSVNELSELPDSFVALTKLEELSLFQNLFATFPRVLLKLPLKKLTIGYQTRAQRGGPARVGGSEKNQAPDGLEAVCRMTTLENLDIDRLELEALPDEIGKL